MPERDLFDGGPVEPVDPLRAVRFAAGQAFLDAFDQGEARRDALGPDRDVEADLERVRDRAARDLQRLHDGSRVDLAGLHRARRDLGDAEGVLHRHRLAMWSKYYAVVPGDVCIYCGGETSAQGADFSPPVAQASRAPVLGPFTRYPACAACVSLLTACPDDCLQQRAGWLACDEGADPALRSALSARMRSGSFTASCRCAVCTAVNAAKDFRRR